MMDLSALKSNKKARTSFYFNPCGILKFLTHFLKVFQLLRLYLWLA